MTDAPAPAPTAWELSSRPGFLIRRLHQIHVSLFVEECGALGVTPVQFSLLSAAAQPPGLEQARLTQEVGVDRTTLASPRARAREKPAGSGIPAPAAWRPSSDRTAPDGAGNR